MNDINFKDCRIAVQEANKLPNSQRKSVALKLLKELTEAISNLTEVEKPSNGWRLARKTRIDRSRNAKLERQQAYTSVCTTYTPQEVEESYKAPRRASAKLPEGETVEIAMAKLRTLLMQEEIS